MRWLRRDNYERCVHCRELMDDRPEYREPDGLLRCMRCDKAARKAWRQFILDLEPERMLAKRKAQLYGNSGYADANDVRAIMMGLL